jgi:hypothetical protein
MSAGEAAAAASGAGAREAYILRPATVAVHLVDARYERQGRYAYIRGADEPTANILRGLGLHLVELDAEAVSHGDLTAYNAVIAGPNAYLLRPELRENAHRLLEYVAGGSTLVVQHQGYGYEARGLAPRPFAYNIPHGRVTDEKAEVTLLDPDDSVFHHPNVIGPADLDGWVRDRGTYFFGQWDQRYKPLLSCDDPGEPPKKGGLLKCDHGHGVYFYVGYTMHKQLLAGVSGAYRLLFNLLSARREEPCG